MVHDPDWWKPMSEDMVDDFLDEPVKRCGFCWIPSLSLGGLIPERISRKAMSA